MGNYEQFRNDVSVELMRFVSSENLSQILHAIDRVSIRYDVSNACMDLSVLSDNIPEIVRIHLAAMAVSHRSKHTIDARFRTLSNFFRSVRKPFDAVNANDIRVYLYNYQIQRNVIDASLDRIRCNIECFYSWCVKNDYMRNNPASKVDPIDHQRAEREPLSMIQLETIRSACVTPRERAVIDFLFSTGCRVSELCDMMRSDVNFESQTVVIRHGKGNKRRVSYLNAKSIVSLREYLATRLDDCPNLFVSERKKEHSLTSQAIQNMIKKITARTDLNINVHPHLFRHTAATRALEAGMPIEQVQQFLGHSKVDTTLIYAKVNTTEIQSNHRKFIA